MTFAFKLLPNEPSFAAIHNTLLDVTQFNSTYVKLIGVIYPADIDQTISFRPRS
jgi:hypothetical protein